MVNRIVAKYQGLSKDIARETGTTPETVEKIMLKVGERMVANRRVPAPPAPEGGISLREAERKYGVASFSITRWTRQNKVKVLLRTNYNVYVLESDVIKMIEQAKNNKGRGRRLKISVIPISCNT